MGGPSLVMISSPRSYVCGKVIEQMRGSIRDGEQRTGKRSSTTEPTLLLTPTGTLLSAFHQGSKALSTWGRHNQDSRRNCSQKWGILLFLTWNQGAHGCHVKILANCSSRRDVSHLWFVWELEERNQALTRTGPEELSGIFPIQKGTNPEQILLFIF